MAHREWARLGEAIEEDLPQTLLGSTITRTILRVVPLGDGVAITRRDVTEPRRGREAEDKFRGLMESAPDNFQ